jgi:Icc protein
MMAIVAIGTVYSLDMPITLPPISRRRFLVSSLATGAGLAIGSRWGWGDDSAARDPNRVVLFSDIHIASDPSKVARGVNMTEHFTQAVAAALGLDRSGSRPGMAMINGDCAFNSGETADYANVVGLLKPLREAGWPVHLGLGNHDNRERFWAAVPADEGGGAEPDRPVDGRQVMVLETPRADWVVLDSLDKTNSTPGVLGEAQLAWLGRVLDAPRRQGKPVIVMVHHQPEMAATEQVSAGASTKPSKIGGITDTPAFMAVVAPRKNVKAVVFGHTHVWAHKRLENGLHLVNLPAVAYVFRPEQPSAWTDWAIADDGAKVTLHCLDKQHPKEADVLDLSWR